MTDKEIVKALKEERHLAEYVDSEYCNAVEVSLISDTIDLINRQKSEIERLTKRIEWLTGYNSNLIDANTALSGEIELMKEESDKQFDKWNLLAEKTKQHYADLYNEAKDILKAEAYKEFAKRLKNKIKTECNPYGKPTFDYNTSISIMHYIDNLVKERR